MPHFLQKTSPRGPVVQAAVMVSHARRDALEQLGLAVPPPQKIVALLDTGASLSAVDPTILAALGLNPTGEAEIHTPSTHGVPARALTYDVAIAILAGRVGDLPFVSETTQVTASGLSGLGIQALIGTDILRRCILTYNGSDGCFTLAY